MNPQGNWLPERPRRRSGVREYPLGDELMLYAPDGPSAHALNPTALAIWRLCDGTRTLDDICTELGPRFDRTPAQLSADVRQAITRLAELSLLAAE